VFGVVGDLGGGPAVALVVLDGQAEFAGAGLELLVVVAALPGGVLDAARMGEGVGGLVHDDGQDLGRGQAERFAADHDLGAFVVLDVPAAGGEVAPAGLAGFGAAGQDDHHRGDLGMVAADGQPGVLQDLDQEAGGPAAGAGFGEVAAGGLGLGRGPGPVVGFAPGRVGEGVAGFGEVPEPGGGVRVAGVGVGVVAAGQLAVGPFDLGGGGTGFDAEQRVIVRLISLHSGDRPGSS
jgi:hypothetical protein